MSHAGTVKKKYPFLISVPHGGTIVPEIVRPHMHLSEEELHYYCDPLTRPLYDFRTRVAAYIDTPVSRMVVDLNRPPLPLPPKDPDGIIKTRTIDNRDVWHPGQVPSLPVIHRLLVDHYFPYHQKIDELTDRHAVRIGFDCHSMLPAGSACQRDAGKVRPDICLGNNGDRRGRAKKNGITTCSPEWITGLAALFRAGFPGKKVAINDPFSGGFITNAHFWRKGTPWIQIEINRAMYEPGARSVRFGSDPALAVAGLREQIWGVLAEFGDSDRVTDSGSWPI